jgi:putative cardiolipin synthase
MNTAIALAETRIETGLSGLKLIADNCDAFAARVLAARSATVSLDLMYYLWHDDHSGRLLIGEVLDAADRGVRVRMLLDDINSRASDQAYLALDGHPNIELRLFNPTAARNGSWLRKLELAWRHFAMTRRMHTKAWIVDRRLAIVGGRNIGDAYFDAADTNFRDLDVLLLGPAVDQAMAIFEVFWESEAALPVHRLNPPERQGTLKAARLAAPGSDAADQLLARVGQRRSIAEFVAADGMHWAKDVRVIADPPEKVLGRRRGNWLMKELMPLIQACRRNLEIVSPYFIPGRTGAAILTKLVRRGVDVEVLTNSLAATDVAAVHGAYSNYRVALLKSGVKLFELQPFGPRSKISVFGSKGASLHTKAFVVDDEAGFVGSFNFDPRSVSLNAEMGVLFEDRAFVAELRGLFQQDKAAHTSYRVFLDGETLRWEGEDDDGVMQRLRHEPEASWQRRLVAFIVRWLPIESQL